MIRMLAAGQLAHVLPCAEKVVLMGIDGEAYAYELSFLMHRIDGARCVVGDADGQLTVDDLAAEEVILLALGMEYPAEGRPFLIRDAIGEAWLASLRVRARTLAELHGAVVPNQPGLTGAPVTWRFADTAHPKFGQEVTPSTMATPGGLVVEGSTGLVNELDVSGAPRWTFVENVTTTQLEQWTKEKREGSGRDPRLSKSTPYGRPQLFREAFANFVDKTPDSELFEGPSAATELCKSISASDLEPSAYVEQFILNSGVAARGGLAMELRCSVHALALLATNDRLNLPSLSGCEHLSRHSLQLMRAAKKNPKSPDFEGLEPYVRHMGVAASTTVRTPKFDQHVSEAQRTEAFIMKQNRLVREETSSHAKAKAKDKKWGENEE